MALLVLEGEGVGYTRGNTTVQESCKIKINGVEIQTYLVDDIQRLPENRIIRHMLDSLQNKGFDFNLMATMTQRGMFTTEEVRQIYQNIGYSVCGYGEIFPEDDIENPLWEKVK